MNVSVKTKKEVQTPPQFICNAKTSLVVSFLILLVSAGITLLSLGLPYGQSASFNIQNVMAFNDQFAQGVWYPRWLNGVDGGGNATFFFYGPLPFWITAIFSVVFCNNCTPTQLIAIALGIFLFASGMAAYLLFRQWANQKISALGATLYMILPYHLAIDGWFRATFGEFSAYIWYPLIFWAIGLPAERRFAAPLLAFFWASLVLSHLPSALLISPIMLIHILLAAEGDQRSKKISGCFLGIIGGTGLAAVYLVPALSLQDTIHSDVWWTAYFNASSWLVGSSDYPNETMMRHIVLSASVSLLVFIPSCYLVRRSNTHWRRFRVWVFSALLCVFMMSSLSAPIWEYAPLLYKVQFPWRQIVFLDLAAAHAFVIALAIRSPNWRSLRSGIVLGAIFLCFVGLNLLYAPLLGHPWNKPLLERQAGKLSRNIGVYEYLPIDVDFSAPELESIRLSKGIHAWVSDGSTVPVSYQGEALLVNIDSEMPVTVNLPRFYHPTWDVYVDDEPVAFSTLPGTALISVSLPPGAHKVEVFRNRLWPERLGVVISIIAAIGLLAWLMVSASMMLLNAASSHTDKEYHGERG